MCSVYVCVLCICMYILVQGQPVIGRSLLEGRSVGGLMSGADAGESKLKMMVRTPPHTHPFSLPLPHTPVLPVPPSTHPFSPSRPTSVLRLPLFPAFLSLIASLPGSCHERASIHPYTRTSIHTYVHPSIHTYIHPSIHTSIDTYLNRC